MDRYLTLKSKSQSLGDEYWKCVTEHLTRPHPVAPDPCLTIERKYRAILNKQMKDLDRLSDRRFVEHERKLVKHYLELIDRDRNRLTSRKKGRH